MANFYKLPKITHVEAPESQARVLEESESAVWMRFKQGDEDAFISIYQTNFHKLYNFGVQFDFEADYVKDEIQELFIYIRNNRQRLADVNSVRFYLMKSLRRRLIRNKKSKFNLVSLFSNEKKNVQEIGIYETPETVMMHQSLDADIRERLSISLNKLTDRQKEAVIHFYYEGFAYQEIAEMMELKMVKSARKLIYRAIEVMRKDLKGHKNKLLFFF